MAAKTVGELGCGLELAATSSQRCSGGVELDRSDRRRLQRGDAGEHVVGLAPSTQAHQAARSNPEVERAEARVNPARCDTAAPSSAALSACSVSPTSKRTIVSMALASAQRWGAMVLSTRRGSDRGRVRARRTASPRPRARAGGRSCGRIVCCGDVERASRPVLGAVNRQNIRSAWARPANVEAAPGRVTLAVGGEKRRSVHVRLGALLHGA